MKKEPEILRNVAKEQGEKEIRESHIRSRIGYIVGEQWAKQRERELKKCLISLINGKTNTTN